MDSGNSIPDWFWQAVQTPPDQGRALVDGCDVCWQAWGPVDAPGLLLVHGMFAHAHWWDFIAPQLADEYRVAALDLAGMGDSDYRHDYSADIWADGLHAVADAAGLDWHSFIVGHSFGGRVGLHAASRDSERYGGLIMVDSGIRHPDDHYDGGRRSMMNMRPVLYRDAQSAQARFRLQPPQPCANGYLLEYIARHSVMPIDGGWAFKFDYDLMRNMSQVSNAEAADNLRALTLPLGMIYGEHSEVLAPSARTYMRELHPNAFPVQCIGDAHHHLFLDQPLEFVRVLRGMLTELGAGGG